MGGRGLGDIGLTATPVVFEYDAAICEMLLKYVRCFTKNVNVSKIKGTAPKHKYSLLKYVLIYVDCMYVNYNVMYTMDGIQV